MTYQIIMTPDSFKDLTELRGYISDVLLAPETALSYIRALRKGIRSLSEMPGRIKVVDDEPWHSRGIRRMFVKNFYVYFRIDDENNRVYILNVIYGKRDQLKALSDIGNE